MMSLLNCRRRWMLGRKTSRSLPEGVTIGVQGFHPLNSPRPRPGPVALPKYVRLWAVQPQGAQPTTSHKMSHRRWRDVLDREASPAV